MARFRRDCTQTLKMGKERSNDRSTLDVVVQPASRSSRRIMSAADEPITVGRDEERVGPLGPLEDIFHLDGPAGASPQGIDGSFQLGRVVFRGMIGRRTFPPNGPQTGVMPPVVQQLLQPHVVQHGLDHRGQGRPVGV